VAAVEFLAVELPPSGYDSWVGGPFTETLTNPDPSLDFDKGGLPTGIEWVVGGDPTQSGDDTGFAPTFDATTDLDGKFLFTYRRRNDAAADPNTTITVEFGSTLNGWNTAAHQGTAANQITISEAPGDAGFTEVTVALPPGLAVSGKLFARLKVLVATP
jgi:hypothetical protein